MSKHDTVFALALCSLGLSACAGTKPEIALPEPTGLHAVGVTTATLVDTERDEPLAWVRQDRRLTVTAWYPAEATSATTRESMLLDLDPDDVKPTIRLMGFAGEVADAMADTPSPAVRDAPRSDARPRWPVLLFSHGFLAAPEFYTATATELASHGYVVVSINHPYESSATHFADGQSLRGKKARFVLGAMVGMRGVQDVAQMRRGPEKAAATETMLQRNDMLDESLRVWVADSRFVLDTLQAVEDGEDVPGLEVLAGGLDLEHVGALGHSFGGATAMALSQQDHRIDAVVNIDGFQYGDVMGKPVPVPALMIESAELPGINAEIYAASPQVQTRTLKHVLHLGMSDLAYVQGLPEKARAKRIGSSDVAQDMRQADAWVLEHMNRWVGRPSRRADELAMAQ